MQWLIRVPSQPSTDFLTICNNLDITPEICHEHTSWCVMDDATFTKGKQDKNTAPDRILGCVAGRILNRDGDVRCPREAASTCFNCQQWG